MTEVVEFEGSDGERVVGLVVERRTDAAGGHRQKRVVVATSVDGEIREIDTAAERVQPVRGSEADLVHKVVGERVEVGA